MSEVAQIIIPKTDTAGAKEAGVPGFIDQILRECYKEKDQQRYLEGLKAFDEEANSFMDLNPAEQVEFVKKINKEAVEQWRALEGIKKKFMGKIYDDQFSTDAEKEFGTAEQVASADTSRLTSFYRTGNFNMSIDKKTKKVLEVFRNPDARNFFMTTKELTVSGFFTSEPGATTVLQYEAVPGAFHGCLPLSEVGKTWATS
ncbi:MAG: gluconate 2-dehydrogenase subunit 3 family protein [Cyclobacteriaceae bacterium]|nr:gluconate 2-dehydrogenase subunit 3 family protein [Cyclobacteriaceae bacterium]